MLDFYSKDIIIEATFASGRLFSDIAFYIGVFVAFLTSFYSWRLIFLVFFGVPRGDDKVHAHAHEAPLIMTLPVLLLAFGALLAGGVFYSHFVGYTMNDFWAGAIFNNINDGGKSVIDLAHYVPVWVKVSPLIASLLGLLVSWLLLYREA